jgi:cytochrome b561
MEGMRCPVKRALKRTGKIAVYDIARQTEMTITSPSGKNARPANGAYTTAAKWLHWSMAVLVLAMLPVGFLMIQEGLAKPLQNTLFIFHKNVGVLLLGLIVIRIIYRVRHAPPPKPAHLPAWQIRAANLSHAALYVLLLVMPVAGYVRVRAGGFPIETLDAMGIGTFISKSETLAGVAKSVHFYGAWAIAGFVALHVGAALHHGIVKRDGVFSRMWRR